LAHDETFDFSQVSAVVMDEFHNFADTERGIVWELSLAMLPASVRLLLLSATVGNAGEFLAWLQRSHGRRLEVVEGRERKVPLTFRWVPDEFLGDQLVRMAQGEGENRTTPALVFCFNRDECWSVAEMLKGLDLLAPGVRKPLNDAVDALEWHEGVGPKLKQMLRRGVGVHHAGLLPRYRRTVESLFQDKLLAVCVCTETLAAGINLPARSVLLTTLVKGPRGKEKLIDASTAHQIFGRAGRPKFDDKGFVFALAHEDDVRLLRWKEKYDQIPENAKDPGLIKAKKALLKKKPTRSTTVKYWSAAQFEQLQLAPPGKLYSKGPIPWRLLAYLLQIAPEVDKVRDVLRKRLMDASRVQSSEKILDRMLLTLSAKGYVTLDPPPPPEEEGKPDPLLTWEAHRATPTPELSKLLVFRSVHPLYGAFLLDHLGVADENERLQALESVLEMPRPLLRYVRPLREEHMPPGPLARERLDADLIRRGLMAAPKPPSEDEDEEEDAWEERPPSLAEKLHLLFEATYPDVNDVMIVPVWAAGEVLRNGGNFNLTIRAKDLSKQEGIIFRHLLRLILLCGEFAQVTPAETTTEEWQAWLHTVSDKLTASCRAVDPTSTDMMIQLARAADIVEGEPVVAETTATEPAKEPEREFGAGIFD
jgi:hypothetical protein